jgi:CRP-like cAMP-binding protein
MEKSRAEIVRESKRIVLATVPLFQSVRNTKVLDDIISALTQRSFRTGTDICVEGRAESTFYVVVSGICRVYKRRAGGSRSILGAGGSGVEERGICQLLAFQISLTGTIFICFGVTCFDAAHAHSN